MRIVIWIFLFYFISSLSTYILIARGEQSRMMWINGVIATLNIIGNILIIPHYSFIGSAWVTLITQVLLMLITYWYIRDNIVIHKNLIFATLLSLIAIISIYLATSLSNMMRLHMGSTQNILLYTVVGWTTFTTLYLLGWWLIKRKI
jgi:O-antigen/teichoic acid export membrane protein